MQLRYTFVFQKVSMGATDFNVLSRISEGRVLRGDDSLHPRLQTPPYNGYLAQKAFKP